MTFEIIAQIVLLGIALSMDAFAVSVTDGLIYQDINKKKALFIALVFWCHARPYAINWLLAC